MRKSVNEIIDNFKELLDLRFDKDIGRLLNVAPNIIATCRIRESPTVLFPLMDYLVANNISIEKVFYKDKL